MRLVLDTNIYCDYAEGVSSIVSTIAEFGEEIYLPTVVIAELTFGFMKGARQEYNEKKLQQVIEQLQIDIIDINKDVARKYAFIYLQLVKKGRKIPINDVWKLPVVWKQVGPFSLEIATLKQLTLLIVCL